MRILKEIPSTYLEEELVEVEITEPESAQFIPFQSSHSSTYITYQRCGDVGDGTLIDVMRNQVLTRQIQSEQPL